ncbi:MAG: hypothetical protein LBI37_00070 [Puniceicoccales bacterium]|jgi:hypothetical protein|nr:hypothetical protein [Puniceicoccales bacterium]
MTESQFSQVVNSEGKYVQMNNNRGALNEINKSPTDPKPSDPSAQESKPSVMLSVDFEKALTIEHGGADLEDPTKNAPVAAENKPVGTI